MSAVESTPAAVEKFAEPEAFEQHPSPPRPSRPAAASSPLGGNVAPAAFPSVPETFLLTQERIDGDSSSAAGSVASDDSTTIFTRPVHVHEMQSSPSLCAVGLSSARKSRSTKSSKAEEPTEEPAAEPVEASATVDGGDQQPEAAEEAADPEAWDEAEVDETADATEEVAAGNDTGGQESWGGSATQGGSSAAWGGPHAEWSPPPTAQGEDLKQIVQAEVADQLAAGSLHWSPGAGELAELAEYAETGDEAPHAIGCLAERAESGDEDGGGGDDDGHYDDEDEEEDDDFSEGRWGVD